MENEKKDGRVEVRFTEIKPVKKEEKKEASGKKTVRKKFIVAPDEPVYTLPVMPPDYDKKFRGKPVEK